MNKKAVTIMPNLTELLIAAICILVGIVLLFGLAKVSSINKDADAKRTLNSIQSSREQINLMRTEYIGYLGEQQGTVADRIILAQHDETIKKEIEQRTSLKMFKGDARIDPVYLPTLDRKIIAVGGHTEHMTSTEQWTSALDNGINIGG